jgi:hypothetical protein
MSQEVDSMVFHTCKHLLSQEVSFKGFKNFRFKISDVTQMLQEMLKPSGFMSDQKRLRHFLLAKKRRLTATWETASVLVLSGGRAGQDFSKGCRLKSLERVNTIQNLCCHMNSI